MYFGMNKIKKGVIKQLPITGNSTGHETVASSDPTERFVESWLHGNYIYVDNTVQ